MDNSMNILLQFLSTGGNPQQIAQNMIRQNPQLRAILNQARNSGMSYDKVQEKLYYCGKLLECDPLCVSCYDFLLTKYLEFTPLNPKGMTLYEFGDTHPKGLYLVRSNGHISALFDNCVYDTWDCRSMKLTNCWKVL